MQCHSLQRRAACFTSPRRAPGASRRTACSAVQTNATADVDTKEITNLIAATALQTGAIALTLYGVDQAMHASFFPSEGIVPKATVWFIFAFLSLRSRLFTVLKADRPRSYKNGDNDKANKGFGDRKRPDWCPPSIAFPIVWSSISVLRATSALMIWEASDSRLTALPLLAFVAHLCIGDTWNYINNEQAKLGLSAVWNTAGVWCSAALVDYLYWQTDTTAGLTLLPMNVWLTVACALIWSIWDLNGRQELLPTVDDRSAA